jgi:ferredoxin
MIYAKDDVLGDQQSFIKLNADLPSSWASITKSKGALPDADEWKEVKDKQDQLVKQYGTGSLILYDKRLPL